ncbi:MAG: hypothetical protein FD187_1719 [bacterium]|nr:MAG: hypothetical protein FD142_780 [bacterium]KAF0148673.1 MAG: hypothetical protein FD187_1719 [bacterium]KAF0168163.1 MAG: hypothetical protein FD158_1556 [bacterium]TXT19684.1 MAG: hypothetical protein FD132_1622 [bacterium]
MQRLLWMLWIPAFLTGCDQLSERAGFPNAAKVEAEGKAIGGACRHAGRGLEDCYRLNKSASKAAVFAGWKEMNEYMLKNNMQTVEPSVGPHAGQSADKVADKPSEKPADKATDKSAEKPAEKPAEAAVGDKPAPKPAEPTLKPAPKPAPKAEAGKPAAPAPAK